MSQAQKELNNNPHMVFASFFGYLEAVINYKSTNERKCAGLASLLRGILCQ